MRRSISIDDKIAKAKLKLEKVRIRYESVKMELKNLMDKREELRPKQLVVAMKDSDRTFDEILNFIRK
ncbi:MAG: hypothetical protein M0P13_11265 [Fibrobacteraceae bacterium]|nr:hypothetical protein [Fibrobacteraceae bacterium]